MAEDSIPLIAAPETFRRAFQEWVRKVRDPANLTDEGSRTISVLNRAAWASYRIAPLPNRTWAIQIDCSYHCGDCRGLGTPWREYESREECLNHFLEVARRHFSASLGPETSSLQQQAQQQMLDELRGGLFGFLEPALDPVERSPSPIDERLIDDENQYPQADEQESGDESEPTGP